MELSDRLTVAQDLHIQFRLSSERLSLTHEARVLLFRTVRELLINIVRHARALNAYVELERDDTTLEIVISDDGIGFQYDTEPPLGSGYGLFSIRERIDALGGHVVIDSSREEGTEVHIYLPIKSVFGSEQGKTGV